MQIVLLCALVAVASVSEVIGLPQAGSQKFNKPDNQTGCHIEGLLIPYGSRAPSKTGCYEYECSHIDNYNRSIMIGHGCSEMAALPPCYITEDKSKPYPACCPYGKCPDD